MNHQTFEYATEISKPQIIHRSTRIETIKEKINCQNRQEGESTFPLIFFTQIFNWKPLIQYKNTLYLKVTFKNLCNFSGESYSYGQNDFRYPKGRKELNKCKRIFSIKCYKTSAFPRFQFLHSRLKINISMQLDKSSLINLPLIFSQNHKFRESF